MESDEETHIFDELSKENLINTSTKVDHSIIHKISQKSFSFPNYLNSQIKINLGNINGHQRVKFIKESDTKTKHTSYKINVEKVEEDGRTTCMIKNIPNKFTAEMLVDFINVEHFGEYDFLYLRMDFKNKCNVGYAFVNFTKCSSVATFYQRLTGKKWDKFSSNKIAEVTYASIQGFENLINKFKKSSIMRLEKSFRPKTFFTYGPLQGLEKPDFY